MSLLKLQEMQKDLSKKELSVASYLLNNIETATTISIHHLAKASSVSTATILRLCNKLGYSGFSDFKVDLILSLNKGSTNRNTYIQEDINLNDSVTVINQKVYAMEKSAIDATYSMIDLDILNKAINLISSSNKLIIFGVGSSALIGKELEYQLIKIKKNISCIFDYHIQHNVLSTSDHNDLLIIFSHSGETKECIKLLELSKKQNVPSIAITRMGHSKVASLANLVLHTSSDEDSSRLIPIKSKVSQLSIINILVANLFVKGYEENVGHLTKMVENQTKQKRPKR